MHTEQNINQTSQWIDWLCIPIKDVHGQNDHREYAGISKEEYDEWRMFSD